MTFIKTANHIVCSCMAMFNFLTFQTFSELLPILIYSWTFTKSQRQNNFFQTNESYCTIKNFLLTYPLTTNLEIATVLKKSIVTPKSWSVVVWRQNLGWSKWDSLKHHLLEQRTIPTWRKCGSRKKCSHSKIFALVQ